MGLRRGGGVERGAQLCALVLPLCSCSSKVAVSELWRLGYECGRILARGIGASGKRSLKRCASLRHRAAQAYPHHLRRKATRQTLANDTSSETTTHG